MTNEERDIITQFIARVGGGQASASAFAGSVPATTGQSPLPAVDREADQLLATLFQRYPDARYRITQLAYVQEHALVEAQNRIKRLEWEVQQAQQAAQQASQQADRGRGGGGGLFGGLFGGGNRTQAPPPGGAWGGGQQGYAQQAAPPPPQYPPNYQPGMFQQRGGSGFLGSALTTAAGVAGGMVAGNALMNMFSGGHGMAGGMAGAASPWMTGAAADQGYVDQGTWGTDPGTASGNQDYVDQGSWDQPAPDTSWTDNSGGGGWDSGGSSTDDDTF